MQVAVVEDDEDVALALSWTLGDRTGWVIHPARSFAQASVLPWHDIDAAVIDYMLGSGGPDGIELAQWLRENHPHVRTCIGTAAPAGALHALSERGIDWLEVVAKPYESADLLRVWERQHD